MTASGKPSATARQWPARAYAGLSFAGTERRLGVHMPDLAEDLDGQSLRVEFVRRLWSHVRPTPAEALTAHLHQQSYRFLGMVS